MGIASVFYSRTVFDKSVICEQPIINSNDLSILRGVELYYISHSV